MEALCEDVLNMRVVCRLVRLSLGRKRCCLICSKGGGNVMEEQCKLNGEKVSGLSLI